MNENIKLLGLCIDKRLSFDEHVSIICMEAGKQLHIF